MWNTAPTAAPADDSQHRRLVERARRHDDEATRMLIAELYPLVIRIVRSHRPRRMDEEDLAQLIFIKMFHKLDQYAGQAPFTHWVSRLAVNTCLNELRSEKARPELRWADLPEEQAEALQNLSQNTGDAPLDEQQANRDLVRTLLDTLNASDRQILTLMDLEGHTVKEASLRTGLNPTLVKVRAFRARHKLRKQLELLSREVGTT